MKNNKSRFYNLVIINLVLFGVWCLGFVISADAMAGKPPEKEEPKYKLEILKMEVVPAPTLQIATKRVLMVIAHRNFQDKEFSVPKALLEKEGNKVTVASSSLTEAKGVLGLKVKPDLLIKDAKAADYDAVVFIGGAGAEDLKNDPQALALAIEAKKYDKIIGAICIAPAILAKAGVLEGKKATVSPYGSGDLKKAGATYTGKDVEVDGKVITGSGPAAAEKFGKAIIEALQKE